MKRFVAVGIIAAMALQAFPAAQEPVERRYGPIARGISREAERAARQDAVAHRPDGTRPTSQGQRRNWAARHPVVVGALAGLGTGLLFDHGSNSWEPLGALIGAGGGSLGGLAASAIISDSVSYTTTGAPEIARVESSIRRLGAGSNVVVVTTDGTRARGKIEAIRDEDFALRTGEPKIIEIRYDTVQELHPAPLDPGVKIGIIGGLVSVLVVPLVVCMAARCGG